MSSPAAHGAMDAAAEASAASAFTEVAAADARALRARVRTATRPSLDAHASWWPAAWRGTVARAAPLGDGGHRALSAWLRQAHTLPAPAEACARPDDAVERLAWIDGPTLRRLALVAGFVAHRDHFEVPGLALEMWRQARRLDPALPDFALSRWHGSHALAMSPRALNRRPRAAGRVVLRRGYQLMRGLLEGGAGAGPSPWASARLKFPRHVSQGPVPALAPAHRAAYRELLFMCVMPERFEAWDWLF